MKRTDKPGLGQGLESDDEKRKVANREPDNLSSYDIYSRGY